MNYLLSVTDHLDKFTEQGGGKAKNLARLAQYGFNVPPWFCIGALAYNDFIRENNLEMAIAANLNGVRRDQLAHVSQVIEKLIVEASLPKKLSDQIEQKLLELRWMSVPLAVRSSGLDEDSDDHSFAGQFSSFLFQTGMTQISSALKLCWASAYSERALSYRLERGLPVTHLTMGVLIQKMLSPEVAGVAFTRHPIKMSDRDQILVSSVYGVGEGLVDGSLDADHFEISRESRKIEAKIVFKKSEIKSLASSGTQVVDVAEERQNKASISDEQALEILDLCIRLEDKFILPQDCEWVYENGQLFLVQTRPITNLPPANFYDKKIIGSHAILWDNSNIIESYSGVTSPLTFAFASRAYNLVYIQFCQVMGVPQTLIDSRASMFRNMLGLVRGRIYYNLINWYQLVLMLPGSSNNKGFMETMMGVKQQIKPDFQDIFAFVKDAPQYSLVDRIKLFLATLYRFIRIDKIVGDFNREFKKIYEGAFLKDYNTFSLSELADEYEYLDKEVLPRWTAPIINDYLCMLFFGLLKKLVENWLGEKGEHSTFQNDLLCGEGGLESAEPTKRLMLIAKGIDQGPQEIRDWFLSGSSEEIWQAIKTEAKHKEIFAKINLFLHDFGFRCVNELKLEEPDLHDNPAYVVNFIAGYIRTKSYNIEEMEKRESAIRAKAETLVRSKISGLKRWVFFWILKQARKAVKNRENLRFARTKIFGICRNLFRAMGLKLVELNLLGDKRDIFFLSTEEIMAFIEGRSLSLKLKEIIAIRKKEYEHYKKSLTPPDRFISLGASGVNFQYPAILDDADLLRSQLVSDDPNCLFGTPCCPGIVKGIVRVATSIEEAQGLNGEILVTSRTDPGWVPLYPACSGLLVERGSLLSHSAVVARELGLPTIVGISGGLMSRLKTGQMIEMDAGKGEVRIITEESK